MENLLTCTAYHGRGKYYFNKSRGINDEALNEYLWANKIRMKDFMLSLQWNLKDKANSAIEELIDDDMRNYLNRFQRDTPTLIVPSCVDKFIKLFRFILHEETEEHESTIHPIEEMYNLMNRCYEKYYEEFRNGIFSLNLDMDFEDRVAFDIATELAEEYAVEGNVKFFFIKRYERNAKNRAEAIRKHGLNCFACDFNFEEVLW